MQVGQSRSKAIKRARSTSGPHGKRVSSAGERIAIPVPARGSYRGGSRMKQRKQLVGEVKTAAALGRQRPLKARGALRQYLQFELTEMERARSVVDCLVAAMRDGRADPRDPHYPDVALVASRMMSKSIVNMNNLLLDDHLPAFAEVTVGV